MGIYLVYITRIEPGEFGQMVAAGLEPTPEAEPTTLLRRASLDLTGLPPTSEEIRGFLADDAEDAFDRQVDRLLATRAFGERMATPWLDLARYADTYGYQSDVGRSVWPYRDWVIRAFNENLPHDDFLRWQVAGDLLPEPTRSRRSPRRRVVAPSSGAKARR